MINNRSAKLSMPRFSAVFYLIFISAFISISGFILWTYVWSPFPDLIDYFALKPDSIAQGMYLWTLVTHMFVHGSILHLLVNMMVLFSLGSLCERIIGRKRFVWFYLISGVFAGILSVLLSYWFGYGNLVNVFGPPNMYMVGASGALFAIAGLFVMLLPKLKFSIIFLPFFTLPAYIMVPLVLFATWVVSIFAGFPIGNVAHLGGFLAGLAYGGYLRIKYKKKVQMIGRYFR